MIAGRAVLDEADDVRPEERLDLERLRPFLEASLPGAGHTRDERFAALLGWVRAMGAQAARALDHGRIHGLGAP